MILKDTIEENKKSLQAANRRISRGVTSETDRLEFELNASMLLEELESIEHEAFITTIGMRAILGVPEMEAVETLTSIPHEHFDELIKSLDVNTLPSVQSLIASENEAQSMASISSRFWMPSLDAYGGYYLHDLRTKDYPDMSEYAVGLKLTLTLWDGGQSHAQAKAKAFQADALSAELVQERRSLKARIRENQEKMKHAHELIHGAEDRILQGKRYVSQTLNEYDRGVKNSPDVLGALQKQFGFRKRLLELKLDYQFSKAELLHVLGT